MSASTVTKKNEPFGETEKFFKAKHSSFFQQREPTRLEQLTEPLLTLKHQINLKKFSGSNTLAFCSKRSLYDWSTLSCATPRVGSKHNAKHSTNLKKTFQGQTL
jgi:hypothetical protein